MKKLITFLLVIMMVFSLVACGDNETPYPSATDNSGVSSTKSTEDTSGSQGNNDSDKVTKDSLNNASVAPVTDFFLTDDGTGNLKIMEYEGNDTILVIPDESGGKKITSNVRYIFANDSKVVAIKFPAYLVEIEESTCGLNTSLQVVVLGSGTKTIKTAAFQGCSSLYDVSLNEGLETIGKFAFAQCENLKSITIPESVQTIDANAFYGHVDGFVIYGEAGSVAETFADTAGIEFKAK